MARPIITAERLWRLLDYDDKTGQFTWRESRGRTAKHAAVAGTINNDGYVIIMIDGRSYGANRLAFLYMTGEWPAGEADHIDRVRSNNAWTNLRDATHRGNAENKADALSNNSTGLLGVSKHHRSERYRARIRVAGRLLQLGWHDSPEAAHAAYVEAKRRLHEGCTI